MKVSYRNSVATLAQSKNATTCSAIVARRCKFGIIPVGSFEEAVDRVITGAAKAALVPGAYPKIGNFFNNSSIRLLRSFASTIPALVLAAQQDCCQPFDVIFAHPATQPFWTELSSSKITPVASNEIAAQSIKNCNQACVTNEVAANSEKLSILRILRVESPMCWNIFVRAS